MKGVLLLFIVLSDALCTQSDWGSVRKPDSCDGGIVLSASKQKRLACMSRNLFFRGDGVGSFISHVFSSQRGRHESRASPVRTPGPIVRFVWPKFWTGVGPSYNIRGVPQTLSYYDQLGIIHCCVPEVMSSKIRCPRRGVRPHRGMSPCAEEQSTSNKPPAFAQPPPEQFTGNHSFECKTVCRPLSCSHIFSAFEQISAACPCIQRRRLVAEIQRYGKLSGVRALRFPLLNVIDFASMRSPALSAEEVLRQQHQSQAVSLQVRVATLAAKIALAREPQRKCSAEEVAHPHQGPSPAMLTQHLHNYRAVLFFTSWDTLSQALIAAVSDLASLLRSQDKTLYTAELPVQGTHIEKHATAGEVSLKSQCVRKNTETQLGRPLDCTAAALSKCIPRPDERVKKDEGLRLLLDRMVPAWLPIIGVRVYNSLVLSQGRRAIEKHKRMLTNRKQLRHHERALLLMVNEGILYGAGHLPTLQIWRVEEGLRRQNSVSSTSSTFKTQSELRGPHVASGDINFMKVLDARGCGPIKLMELAGGNPEPWRVEEALVLDRARVSQGRKPAKKRAKTGILSGGSGSWSSTSCPDEIVKEDINVWLAQLSTLYQYHALSLLLKRLSYAERQFPEYEEFNLRKLRLTRAKQKGFLSDTG